MNPQELQGFYESYLEVYSQSQELTEEVEIASQYFYEMGLNENGVDILIEELGLDEFVEWVYDLSEEYVLTEARAGGVKIEPKLSSGKAIKGKPKAASLKALRKKKAARQEAENAASEAKPSGMKASLQRQSAIANAKKKQPKKKGILDRVAGAVLSGIERHNTAMNTARSNVERMRKDTAVTVGKVKKAAGEFKKGFVGEEVDIYDIILSHLLDEGYAETPEAAEVIMVSMSEEWRESIMSEYFSIGGPSVGGGGSRGPSGRQRRRQEQEKRGHELRSRAKRVVDSQRRGSHGEADSQMSAQPDRKKDYDPNSGWAHYYDDSAKRSATALRPRG